MIRRIIRFLARTGEAPNGQRVIADVRDRQEQIRRELTLLETKVYGKRR